MQVSVETLEGLKRKMTVSIPKDEIEEKVSSRLKDLSKKVKVAGFRPGKVPKSVVESRYSNEVREEVAAEVVRSTLYEALEQNGLLPAGHPSVDMKQLEPGKDFEYIVSFEILPVFEVTELGQVPVELVSSVVQDKDVQGVLEKLREKNTQWEEVSRAVKKGDQVTIDFQGSLENKAFEGGSAEDHVLVIGSNAMIPGFEEGIIGAKKDKPFDIQVSFPEDYGHKELAGKEVNFHIVVKKVMEGSLPELNEDFVKKFDIKEGGVEAFTQEIKDNMARELERRVNSLNRKKLFDKLVEVNPINLPVALIDKEVEHLKHELYHRLFGHEHKENEKIPDFPRELFEAEAKQRVHLGLVFSEYVKKHQISSDEASVKAMIDKMAGAYEDPEEIRAWYQDSKEHLAEIEALVMEDLAAEKIAADAKIAYKSMDYDSVMNPQHDVENKGE